MRGGTTIVRSVLEAAIKNKLALTLPKYKPFGATEERYFTGAVWSLVGACTARSLTLVSSIAVARILSDSSYGILGMIQSSVGMVGVLAGAGLSLATLKMIAMYRQTNIAKAHAYYELSLQLSAITGTVMSLMFFVLTPWIASKILRDVSITTGLSIASLLVLFGALNGVQYAVLSGTENFRNSVLSVFLRSALALVGTVVGAKQGGVNGAAIGLVAAEFFSFCVNRYLVKLTWISCCLHHCPPVTLSRREVKAFFSLSVPALLAGLAIQPAIWFCNIILFNQVSGQQALGYFTAADKWRQLLLFLPFSVSANAVPIMSNLHGANNLQAFKRISLINLVLSLSIVAVPVSIVVLVSHTLMSSFGVQYGSSWRTLNILALSSVFVVANTVLGQSIVSMGKLWLRFGFDLLLGALMISSSIILIPSFLENGLAYANLIAYAVVSTMLFVVSWKYISDEIPLHAD